MKYLNFSITLFFTSRIFAVAFGLYRVIQNERSIF